LGTGKKKKRRKTLRRGTWERGGGRGRKGRKNENQVDPRALGGEKMGRVVRRGEKKKCEEKLERQIYSLVEWQWEMLDLQGARRETVSRLSQAVKKRGLLENGEQKKRLVWPKGGRMKKKRRNRSLQSMEPAAVGGSVRHVPKKRGKKSCERIMGGGEKDSIKKKKRTSGAAEGGKRGEIVNPL